MPFTTSQVVNAIYRAALRRDADSDGLTHFSRILDADPDALLAVADGFFTSEEHQALFANQPGIADHSQFGEFGKILKQLIRVGSRHQIIVDVGARGRMRSNSYDLLSMFDWRGLLVEANPALHETIRREFSGTNFELVPCAVGTSEGTLPFYIGSNDDVSSLLAEATSTWGDIQGVISVPVEVLSSVLDKHDVPVDFDVLSLDIEGLDLDVLDQLVSQSSYRPRVVVIEASYDFKTKHLRDLGLSEQVLRSYGIVDATPANLILSYQGT